MRARSLETGCGLVLGERDDGRRGSARLVRSGTEHDTHDAERTPHVGQREIGAHRRHREQEVGSELLGDPGATKN